MAQMCLPGTEPALMAALVQPPPGATHAMGQVIEGAMLGMDPGRCMPPPTAGSDLAVAVSYCDRVLRRALACTHMLEPEEQAQLLPGGAPPAVQLSLLQYAALAGHAGGGAAGGGATLQVAGGAGHVGAAQQQQRVTLAYTQPVQDPATAHLAHTAAANPVAVTQFAAPAPLSEVGRWAAAVTTAGAARPTTTPKAVVQFSMADDASRRDVRGEIAPSLWSALGRDWDGRKASMEGEMVFVLGNAARGQLRKQIAAMMSFQFTKMMKPAALAKLHPVQGAFGGETAVRVVSESEAVAMVADAMAAGFPEFDWQPMREVATAVGRILSQPGVAAETEASSLYDWAMRTLQDAGRAARDDTSTAPLRLVDTPTFRLEVRDKYSEAVSSLEKQLRTAAGLRAELGVQGGAATAAAGAGTGGSPLAPKSTALGRALGVGALDAATAASVQRNFAAKFGGKCIYQALAGACKAPAHTPCPHSHEGLPSREELQAWAATLGYTLP